MPLWLLFFVVLFFVVAAIALIVSIQVLETHANQCLALDVLVAKRKGDLAMSSGRNGHVCCECCTDARGSEASASEKALAKDTGKPVAAFQTGVDKGRSSSCTAHSCDKFSGLTSRRTGTASGLRGGWFKAVKGRVGLSGAGANEYAVERNKSGNLATAAAAAAAAAAGNEQSEVIAVAGAEAFGVGAAGHASSSASRTSGAGSQVSASVTARVGAQVSDAGGMTFGSVTSSGGLTTATFSSVQEVQTLQGQPRRLVLEITMSTGPSRGVNGEQGPVTKQVKLRIGAEPLPDPSANHASQASSTPSSGAAPPTVADAAPPAAAGKSAPSSFCAEEKSPRVLTSEAQGSERKAAVADDMSGLESQQEVGDPAPVACTELVQPPVASVPTSDGSEASDNVESLSMQLEALESNIWDHHQSPALECDAPCSSNFKGSSSVLALPVPPEAPRITAGYDNQTCCKHFEPCQAGSEASNGSEPDHGRKGKKKALGLKKKSLVPSTDRALKENPTSEADVLHKQPSSPVLMPLPEQQQQISQRRRRGKEPGLQVSSNAGPASPQETKLEEAPLLSPPEPRLVAAAVAAVMGDDDDERRRSGKKKKNKHKKKGSGHGHGPGQKQARLALPLPDQATVLLECQPRPEDAGSSEGSVPEGASPDSSPGSSQNSTVGEALQDAKQGSHGDCPCGAAKAKSNAHAETCLYPFTNMNSRIQRKIREQYDELVQANMAKTLTLAQVGRFTTCLVEAKQFLQQKSESIQRRFTISRLLLSKAEKSSLDRLCGQIYALEIEQKKLEEDTVVYNRMQEQLKLSPAYQKMLEYGEKHFELLPGSDQLVEKADSDSGEELSFEELLEQEKKDPIWQTAKLHIPRPAQSSHA